jgi:putative PIN family toxin of toxin-antitoxin system
MRYVLDTNVLISGALFPDSAPGRALRVALREGTVLASAETLAEVAEVLGRPKLDRYLTWNEREEFLAALARRVEIVQPETQVQMCRDPDDDCIVELAIDGKADLIVTGDRDLLSLSVIRGVRIVTPARFIGESP